jgi:hypothetical protein
LNKNNYNERILGVLSEAIQPMDVEKIRSESGIGHWNTALSHCLELLVNKRICGTKTSKSWIFWIEKEVVKAEQ